MVNEDLTLYEFIGNDPIKAFYLGLNIQKWYQDIDRKQRYLYSKKARHNKDDIEKYLPQLEFWTKQYHKEGEVDMVELSEYIMNNIFWDKDTEDRDKVKMAFFFGNVISKQLEDNKNEYTEKAIRS